MGRVFTNPREKGLLDPWDMGCVTWEDSLEVGGKLLPSRDLECPIVVSAGTYAVRPLGNSFYPHCVQQIYLTWNRHTYDDYI